MKKSIFIALLAAGALNCAAQQTMYLVKGDRVVAKYGVEEVDYVSFELPAGVVDLPEGGGLVNTTFQGAAATYYGTEDGCGNFQVVFSTKSIVDENPPMTLMYLQFSTPAVTDITDITLAEGVYTLAEPGTVGQFKFYGGERAIDPDGEKVGGTLIVDRPNNATTDITLVTDGQFSVKKADNGYAIAGMFKLENGSVLDFNYTGAVVIDNKSSEQLPPDEEPLPASSLIGDVDFTVYNGESYGTVWTKFFADEPRFDYVYILLYGDGNYADLLQLALVVDREKYPDTVLPKGTYSMISRAPGALTGVDTASYPAFSIKTDTGIVDYGCWLVQGYSERNPLVSGQVEVLEDATSLDNVKLRVTLRDNSDTPHTVTCSFDGRLFPL